MNIQHIYQILIEKYRSMINILYLIQKYMFGRLDRILSKYYFENNNQIDMINKLKLSYK